MARPSGRTEAAEDIEIDTSLDTETVEYAVEQASETPDATRRLMVRTIQKAIAISEMAGELQVEVNGQKISLLTAREIVERVSALPNLPVPDEEPSMAKKR